MLDVYRYLVKSDRTHQGERAGGRADERAVEDVYALEELATKPVVRDELNNRFIVFPSRDALLREHAALPPAERCFHEVVFGRLPQRLKFDVDAPGGKVDALPDDVACAGLAAAEAADAALADVLGFDGRQPPPGPTRDQKARGVVDQLIEAVLDELAAAYGEIEGVAPTRSDLAVCESSGPTAAGVWKYSYHLLVLPYAVADHEEAKEFTARVRERLPAAVRALVDPDVNKRTQCFRLAGSAKPGTSRVKRATAEAAAAFGTSATAESDLFVTAAPGARVLTRAYAVRDGADGPPAAAPPAGLVRAALAAAGAAATAGHEFTVTRPWAAGGSVLCFRRVAPSHCRLCGETHHRDNSLMLTLTPGDAPGEWALAERCRQAPRRSLAVGPVYFAADDFSAVAPPPPDAGAAAARTPAAGRPAARAPASAAAGRPPPLSRLAQRVADVAAGRVDPHVAMASAFERLPDARKTVYAEGVMRPYEHVPTLAVAAQMKLGKTKALRRYVDTHFPASSIETKVVRFVTFRQTFGRSVAEAFPDFTLYSDVPTGTDLDHVRYPRLIVQVESLHRLKMAARPEPVDLLVLDEVESILAQFSSGLHRHLSAAFAMFSWMMATARHVVCMDANLGDRTYRTLERMRPAHPPHFHWNRFARAAGDTYRFTADQGAWLGALYAAVSRGERVVVPTNSLAEARAFDEALRREFPARRVAFYSSETPPSERARHFADVHRYWGELDVLIFTPTCSAGVSFELAHFDSLYAYFCDASCDVETCRQMLGRVRNLSRREHTVCVRAGGAALPDTPDDVRRLLYDRRAGLSRAVGDDAIHFDYTPDGEIRYYESDYFHLWLETTAVANRSRNDFARRLVDQVADTGAAIAMLDDAPAAGDLEAGAALLASHRVTRADLDDRRCAAVAASPDLEFDEAARVRDALTAQRDVSPDLRLALEKYHLRDTYSWHGRPVDAAFVSAYGGHTPRRVYRALCRVAAAASTRAALEAMRQREAARYGDVMDARTAAGGGGASDAKHATRNTADACEGRDLSRAAYVSQAHRLALWILDVCGLSLARLITGGAPRIHAGALEARLRAAAPALARAEERIVFEFEVPRPGFARAARDPDPDRFLAAALRPINSVLRSMYGIQVRRVPGGGGMYALGWGAVGRLFVFVDADGRLMGGGAAAPALGDGRPVVVCALVADGGGGDDGEFLDAEFYGRPNADGDDAANADDDAADAAAVAAAAAADAAFDNTQRGLDDFLSDLLDG